MQDGLLLLLLSKDEMVPERSREPEHYMAHMISSMKAFKNFSVRKKATYTLVFTFISSAYQSLSKILDGI